MRINSPCMHRIRITTTDTVNRTTERTARIPDTAVVAPDTVVKAPDTAANPVTQIMDTDILNKVMHSFTNKINVNCNYSGCK